MADRLSREVGHVCEPFVVQQCFLILFGQPQSFCILDELLLRLLAFGFQSLNLQLQTRDPRPLFVGRIDLACQCHDSSTDRHIGRTLSKRSPLFFQRLNLAPFVIDLFMNLLKLGDRIVRQVGPCIECLDFRASRFAGKPRFANLQRRFYRFGFKFPLFDSLSQLVDFILLISSQRCELAPSAPSTGQLLDFITQLFSSL